MTSNEIKKARFYKRKGYELFKECFSAIWSVVIRNLAIDAELTKEQTDKIVQIKDEIDRVMCGFMDMELSPTEYADYIVEKAEEAVQALKEDTGDEEG